MTANFQSGAQEELRLVMTTSAQDVSSGTNMQVIPHGGNPTGPNKAWSRGITDEVTNDLTPVDNAVKGFTVPADFQNTIRYGTYDLVLQQPFNNLWSTPAFTTGVVTTIGSSVAGGANKLVATVGTPFSTLSALLPCPVWICRGGGTPITGRPVIALSTGAAGAELNLAQATANGIALTTVAAGDSIVVQVDAVLKNGTTIIYALLERAQVALGHFRVGYGMVGTQVDFSGQKGQDPTYKLVLAGVDYASATATFGTGTNTAANANRVFTFGSEFKFFRENGTVVATLLPHKITWSLQSPTSAVDPAGMDGAYDFSKNQYKLSGEVDYFSNTAGKAVGDRADAAGDSSLFYSLVKTYQGTTNAYTYWLPFIQYPGSTQEGGGANGILQTYTKWDAAKDPVTGLLICIARFANVPLSLV